MKTQYLENAKKCCSAEYDRLMEGLSACDQKYVEPEKHHRCYRVVATRSGRRARRCISEWGAGPGN